MKSPIALAGFFAAVLITGLLTVPAQAGKCGSGGCGGGGGGSVGTFKGKASRLPTITKVGDEQFTAGRKTYFIGGRTSITVDGKRAEPSDLAVGMRVMVTSRVVAKGDTVESSLYQASRITARSHGVTKTETVSESSSSN